ncbi:MAG: hypothetical protein U0324_25640 [Polyangiales bacterium]
MSLSKTFTVLAAAVVSAPASLAVLRPILRLGEQPVTSWGCARAVAVAAALCVGLSVAFAVALLCAFVRRSEVDREEAMRAAIKWPAALVVTYVVIGFGVEMPARSFEWDLRAERPRVVRTPEELQGVGDGLVRVTHGEAVQAFAAEFTDVTTDAQGDRTQDTCKITPFVAGERRAALRPGSPAHAAVVNAEGERFDRLVVTPWHELPSACAFARNRLIARGLLALDAVYLVEAESRPYLLLLAAALPIVLYALTPIFWLVALGDLAERIWPDRIDLDP